jgi:hypothetical protein
MGSQNSQIYISIKRKLFVDVVVDIVVDDAVVDVAVVADVFVVAVVVVCVDGVTDVVAIDDDDVANNDTVFNWSLLRHS